MSVTLKSDPLPLSRDDRGAIRIGNSRVLLEFVIRAYKDGASAEEIARRFDTLQIADVHAVLAHYLRHRSEVEEYLTAREAEARELRDMIESAMPPRVSRDELQARLASRVEP